MYREWKKTEFPKKYYIWIWEQQDWEVDQEIDGKMRWERMEEAPENGKESSHSARANGINESVVINKISSLQTLNLLHAIY